MPDDPTPQVRYEAYNPATDEAPAGGPRDCAGDEPAPAKGKGGKR